MIEARIRMRAPSGFPLEISLAAKPGITVLLGPRGSGKTPALEAIAGFLRPEQGRILIDDRIVFDAEAGIHLAPRARRCPLLSPKLPLFPHMSLRGNLEFAAAHFPPLERRRRIAEMLERFRLREIADRRPHQLSMAEQQRGLLARALLAAPRALLLDDVGAGLDARSRSDLHSLLREIPTRYGIPLLAATRDLAECVALADQMILMGGGRIWQSGSPQAVLDHPAHVEAARLLGLYSILPAEILELDPQRNSSRLRVGEFELSGPYFPARLRGDRVWLCVERRRLAAVPRAGPPGANQIAAELRRAVPTPAGVRLEFEEEFSVDLSAPEYEKHKHNKDWLVTFPAGALRVL